MLKRPDDAQDVLHKTASAVGWSYNLQDQLAAIAFNNKHYQEALRIWCEILPNWKADELVRDPQPVYGARYAGIAANLGKWIDAAQFFGEAAKRAIAVSTRPWTIGLMCDQGYALWKAGQFEEATALFAKVVAALEELPNTPESFDEYAVQKLVGHTLASTTLSDMRCCTRWQRNPSTV